MAVSALVALASTTASYAAGTMVFSTFLGTFAFNFALGVALNALTPKPKVSGANRGYQVNARGSALDHQIIYGKMKTGGAIVFDGTTGVNNKQLHRVLAVAGHEIKAFEEIYINDAKVTNLESDGNVLEVELPDGTLSDRYDGKIRINKHLGASNQSADSDLVSEVTDWTNRHRLRGIAYLYVRLTFDADTFPNGVPEITTVVKGKKVYDPRTNTTVWSDNPALCLRDYLTSTSYGLGEVTANVDDDLISTAANVCDY